MSSYLLYWTLSKVCEQCVGSGMFIPDPDFSPSRILDLGSRIQKQQWKTGVKKNLLSYLFVAFRSCWNRSWLITVAHFAFFHFLTQEKIGFKLSEIMVGSGIRKKPIPDPRSRIQGSKRYRIPDPDPQHWWNLTQAGLLIGGNQIYNVVVPHMLLL